MSLIPPTLPFHSWRQQARYRHESPPFRGLQAVFRPAKRCCLYALVSHIPPGDSIAAQRKWIATPLGYETKSEKKTVELLACGEDYHLLLSWRNRVPSPPPRHTNDLARYHRSPFTSALPLLPTPPQSLPRLARALLPFFMQSRDLSASSSGTPYFWVFCATLTSTSW